MRKLGIISAVLLAVGCMGIITVKNCLISSSVEAASRLIADTVVLGMEDCYINVYGRATGDSDFAEVIQRLDSAATPEYSYDLMNEELSKRLYDVYGTMLKWSVDVGYGMYANYALVDFNADARWDFALKAVTESPEQDVFFYCLSGVANPTDSFGTEALEEKLDTTESSDGFKAATLNEESNLTGNIRVMVSDKELQAEKPNDRSIASIVGVVTIDGVDILLASKAEFDYTRIYSTEDARHLIKVSLDAVLVDNAEQCSAFFCLL